MPDPGDTLRPQLAFAEESQFLGHPRGLATLFFTEMWERFSYYGMRALLILFMTADANSGGLGLSTSTSGLIYGLYTSLIYMAALPGGWIADRVTGQRIAVWYGGMFIALGNFILIIPSIAAFYCGLTLGVIGTGLLKPNVSTIVGQLYKRQDNRRDAGFSIFYMGINLGAFLSPLACGWIAARAGWRYGFLLAGLGMTLGLIQLAIGRKHLGEAGLAPAIPNDLIAKRQLTRGILALISTLLAVSAGAVYGLLSARALADASGAILLITVVAVFGWMLMGERWTSTERRGLLVILFLFLAATVFWSVFEQAGSSMNLFAQRSTDNYVAGFEIPAPWYQSINALLIITLAPVFGALWVRLGDREPSSPSKFALALILVGAGFLVLAAGASLASSGVKVSPVWLLITYVFHTAGELCLSPVGLSAMTRLAPSRVGGLMMGTWFLALSVGNYMGGRLAALYEALPLHTLFGVVGMFAMVAGVVLAAFSGRIKRLMEGVR